MNRDLQRFSADRWTAALFTVLLAGTFLRLYRLGDESFWLDEITSIVDATTNTSVELLALPFIKGHLPLYYILLRNWIAVFGTSEASVRFLSAIFGIATIGVVYLVATRLYDRWIGLLSAGFLAFSPFHIYYSQEARMYTLLALLATLSFYWLVRVAENNSRYNVVGYLLTTILLAYTHVFSLFILLAQSLYVFITPLLRQRDARTVSLRHWIGIQAVIGALISPWLLYLLYSLLAPANGDSQFLGWLGEPTLGDLYNLPVAYFRGYDGYAMPEAVLFLLFCLLVGLAVVGAAGYARRSIADQPAVPTIHRAVEGHHEAVLLGLWVLVPVIVPFIASHLISPMFFDRYTISASVGLFVLIAAGVRNLRYRHLRLIVVIILVVAVLGSSLPGYYATEHKTQWDETAAHVEENAEAGDLVLVSESYTQTPFLHYFEREDVTVEPVDSSISDDELRATIDNHDRVWVVLSHLDEEERQRITGVMEESHERVEDESYGGTTSGLELYYYEHAEEEGQSSEEGV